MKYIIENRKTLAETGMFLLEQSQNLYPDASLHLVLYLLVSFQQYIFHLFNIGCQ